MNFLFISQIALLLLAASLCVSANSTVAPQTSSSPSPPISPDDVIIAKSKTKKIPMIIDTDIGAWPDDVGTLAMLHRFADRSAIDIVAIMANNAYEGIVPVIDAMNRYFGRPNITIGMTKDAVNAHNFTSDLRWPEWILTQPDLFPHPRYDSNSEAPDAVALYRELLANAPDHSITLLSIGYWTNLANLLASAGDRVSPLDGRDLLRTKVRHTYAMAGEYPTGTETNIVHEPRSARAALPHWPTPLTLVGFELGNPVLCGANLLDPRTNTSIDPRSPVGKIFEKYVKLYKLDGCYDQIAALIAVDDHSRNRYFEYVPGRIEIALNGTNYWNKNVPITTQWYARSIVPAQTIIDAINPLLVFPAP